MPDRMGDHANLAQKVGFSNRKKRRRPERHVEIVGMDATLTSQIAFCLRFMLSTVDQDTALRPLYLVRVKTANGTFSVAYNSAARALKAVTDFQAAGFSQVGVYDSEGAVVAFADLKSGLDD